MSKAKELLSVLGEEVVSEDNPATARKMAKDLVADLAGSGYKDVGDTLSNFVDKFEKEYGEDAAEYLSNAIDDFVDNTMNDEFAWRELFEDALDQVGDPGYDDDQDESSTKDQMLDKVYASILMDFDKKVIELKKYVDGILPRRTPKNIDDMISNVSEILAKYSKEFKNL